MPNIKVSVTCNNPDPTEDYEVLNLLRVEMHRRSTFPQRSVWTDLLAMNGFYYPGHGSDAKCIFCKGGISLDDRSGHIAKLHRRRFPHCVFARGYPAGNIPVIRAHGELFIPYERMPQHLVEALEYEPWEMRLLIVGMPALFEFDPMTDEDQD
jgi:hypothetical protein